MRALFLPMQALAAIALGLALVSAGSARAWAADEKVSGPEDPDFKFQGEYVGDLKAPDGGAPQRIGVQVIAQGGGKFNSVGYPGGLPGDGAGPTAFGEVSGELQEGAVVFKSDEARGEVKDGVLRVVSTTGDTLAELKKVERTSPTMGAAPPTGAVVLFDGKQADAFVDGKVTDDGLLISGATSKQKFGSCQVHLEFRLPFMPEARGQGRGNSGVYLQGRYEVQMLDSFGLKGEDNECGGIYSIRKPDVNMCLPPLAWQTYDIDFTAAKYDGDKKVKNATLSVRHNGQLIHKDVELPKTTTAAPVPDGPAPGPLYLQDHGNPVRYRNLWVVEKP